MGMRIMLTGLIAVAFALMVAYAIADSGTKVQDVPRSLCGVVALPFALGIAAIVIGAIMAVWGV